jgi:hypothetical protein
MMNVSLLLEPLQAPQWTRYVIEAHTGDLASSASRASISAELIDKVSNLLESNLPLWKRGCGSARMPNMPHPFSDVQRDRNSCGPSAFSHSCGVVK